MEKFYPLLNWLNMEKATRWLSTMTETLLGSHDLISLCCAGQCDVYVNVGQSAKGIDGDFFVLEVTGSGIQKVT